MSNAQVESTVILEEQRGILTSLLKLVTLFSLILLLISALFQATTVFRLAMIMLSVSVLSFWWLRLQWYVAVGWLISATMIATSNYAAFIGHGIYDVSVMIIPVAVIFAGMVLPINHIYFFVFLTMTDACVLSAVDYSFGVNSGPDVATQDHILFPLFTLGIHLLMVQTIKRLRLLLFQNRQEKIRWKSIFHQSSDGMMLLSGDGKIVDVNPKLNGWMQDSLQFSNDTQFELPFWPLQPDQPDEWLIPNGANQRICLVSGRKIPFQDEVIWVCNVRDVTEERNLKSQLLQESTVKMVGQVATTIAHDLNNQLASIVALADLLEESSDMLEVNMLANEIGNIAVRAGKRTSNLLSSVRQDSEDLTLVFIEDVLNDAHRNLSLQATHEVTLNLVIPKGMAPFVVNQEKLHHALVNLGVNALEATEDLDDPIVELGCRAEDGCVAFWVTDNGRGMSTEDLQRVREVFFTTKPEGTGVGLFSVEMCAKTHGGHLNIESELDKGSTFTLFIATEAIPQEPTEPFIRPLLSRSSIVRVLLVEDNEPLGAMLKKGLENADIVVKWVQSGEECVQILNEDPMFSVLVMDYQLPDCSGGDLLSRLQSPPPIIAISGDISSWDGYSDKYPIWKKIPKPFLTSDLLHVVKEIAVLQTQIS